jgi:Co/Zn/Cd efflux system component
MNVHAVFLHYLGDMISSALVLVAGILLFFFGHELWTGYLDAITSLVIVVLILVTTVPLGKKSLWLGVALLEVTLNATRSRHFCCRRLL